MTTGKHLGTLDCKEQGPEAGGEPRGRMAVSAYLT